MKPVIKNEDLREKREELRREEIRHSILHAAEAVIIRKGFSAMTMDDVAGEARISKVTLYKYVRSKGSFLFEIMNQYLNVQEEKIRRIADSEAGASEKLRLVIRDIVRTHKEKNNLSRVLMEDRATFNFMRLLFKADSKTGNDRFRKNLGMLKRKDQDIMKLLSRIIEEGVTSGEFIPVDPMETAVFIDSFLGGINHSRFRKGKLVDLSDDELSEKIFVFISSSIRIR
jgi:AcrR family transcriptional regulator